MPPRGVLPHRSRRDLLIPPSESGIGALRQIAYLRTAVTLTPHLGEPLVRVTWQGLGSPPAWAYPAGLLATISTTWRVPLTETLVIPSTKERVLLLIPYTGSVFPETGFAPTLRYHSLKAQQNKNPPSPILQQTDPYSSTHVFYSAS